MRDSILAWAEKRLGKRRIASKDNASELTVHGQIDGAPIAVRASRSSRGHWMTLTVKVPAVPVLIALEPRTASDDARIASGAILGVHTGDPSIDAVWLMEAAPAALAREIMDESVRSRMAALPACSAVIDEGSIELCPDKARSVSDQALEGMLGFALTLRERMVAVHEARRSQRVDETADREQVERLRALRDKLWARASWPARAGIIVLVAALVAAALAFVRSSFFPS